MASQLGPRWGSLGGYTQKWSTYTHMHDRLDKSCSALAEARLKTFRKKELILPKVCRPHNI